MDSPSELSALWTVWEHCACNNKSSDNRASLGQMCRLAPRASWLPNFQQRRDVMYWGLSANIQEVDCTKLMPQRGPPRQSKSCSPTHEILRINGTQRFITWPGPSKRSLNLYELLTSPMSSICPATLPFLHSIVAIISVAEFKL
jgi:hypothetical protein